MDDLKKTIEKIDLDLCKTDYTAPYHITMIPVTALIETRL